MHLGSSITNAFSNIYACSVIATECAADCAADNNQSEFEAVDYHHTYAFAVSSRAPNYSAHCRSGTN
eukprot:gene1244-1646_t